jgi:hypothetical protein
MQWQFCNNHSEPSEKSTVGGGAGSWLPHSVMVRRSFLRATRELRVVPLLPAWIVDRMLGDPRNRTFGLGGKQVSDYPVRTEPLARRTLRVRCMEW